MSNESEWKNPDNWSHPIWGVYFSRKDTRSWVPKKLGVGWMPNMGHPHATWWLAGLIIGAWWLGRLKK